MVLLIIDQTEKSVMTSFQTKQLAKHLSSLCVFAIKAICKCVAFCGVFASRASLLQML